MREVNLAIGILEILLGLVIIVASMTIPSGSETSTAVLTIFLSGIVVIVGGIILLAVKR